jgi:hypothetical protein
LRARHTYSFFDNARGHKSNYTYAFLKEKEILGMTSAPYYPEVNFAELVIRRSLEQ